MTYRDKATKIIVEYKRYGLDEFSPLIKKEEQRLEQERVLAKF